MGLPVLYILRIVFCVGFIISRTSNLITLSNPIPIPNTPFALTFHPLLPDPAPMSREDYLAALAIARHVVDLHPSDVPIPPRPNYLFFRARNLRLFIQTVHFRTARQVVWGDLVGEEGKGRAGDVRGFLGALTREMQRRGWVHTSGWITVRGSGETGGRFDVYQVD
ncbi:MAG: hypothetical protein LQ350_002853 [Teloschistes chrysophthalmus]|nr:MAG: hypothetical protein LQ350_002853 [Niorma chrysophthalma]